MKQLASVIVLAAVLAAGGVPGSRAATSAFVNTSNAGDGLLGYHVSGAESSPRGFVLDYNDATNTAGNLSLGWSLGLERTNGDLYLFNYNYVNNTTITHTGTNGGYSPFRLRGDTGQLELGQNVPHPQTQQQLNVTAGNSTLGRTGIGVGTYGNQAALYLHQISRTATPPNQPAAPTLRNQIVFGADGQPNIYALGTDSGDNGTPDWWLWNSRTSHFPLMANANDSLSINYGATITGTTTVNGATSLLGTTTVGSTGSLLGFYGATPVSKPVVTGCTCDGSALKSLIQALAAQGLVIDNTTQ